MSCPEEEYEAEEMSAAASATLSLGAPWRGPLVCSGCGQRPEHMVPLAAVAVARVLARRCASLLHHHEDSLAHRRGAPGSWSAMEPATKVSAVLGATNDRLRKLLGEEIAEPVLLVIEEAELVADIRQRELSSLANNVNSLIATIEGATVQDWDRARPNDGPTAAEMVWLALHEATHHLEDAELVLDAALADGGEAWAASDAQVILPRRHGRA